MGVTAALVLTIAGCAPPHPPLSGAGQSATTPPPAQTVPQTAAPYRTPAQPPQESEPLHVDASRDARERLSRVLTGNLVDSGDFHASSWDPDVPMTQDPGSISFLTPSGNIACSGGTSVIVCASNSPALARPPRPVHTWGGNWEPYVEFDGKITYGVAAGNPMLPSKANTLPYGSTVRFGDIECLSARDGITCVHLSSSTGFHLSREDLTPLKALDPVPADTRIEPHAPSNAFCGAKVTPSAINGVIASLPNNSGRRWTVNGVGDDYSCRDLQLFQVSSNDRADQLPAVPTFVLVFDHGRFMTSVTDRPYAGLRGGVDKADPTLIHLVFTVTRDGQAADAPARARYDNGRVRMLDPIPDGAIAAT